MASVSRWIGIRTIDRVRVANLTIRAVNDDLPSARLILEVLSGGYLSFGLCPVQTACTL
jgi:hypothetical protein